MRGEEQYLIMINRYQTLFGLDHSTARVQSMFQDMNYTYMKLVLAPVKCLPRNRLGIGASWSSPHTSAGLVMH
jgi:hypothetical protein